MLLGEKWKFIRNLFGIMHYYFKLFFNKNKELYNL